MTGIGWAKALIRQGRKAEKLPPKPLILDNFFGLRLAKILIRLRNSGAAPALLDE
jgi:hypothetical protein